MKSRTLSFILAAVMLIAALSLAGCKGGGPADPGGASNEETGCATFSELVDTAVLFAQTSDPQLIKKLSPPGEIEFKTKLYAEQGKDYFELLQMDLDNSAAAYTENCGEDWKITYVLTKVNEKDAEGVENYRSFDSFYIEDFGLDPAKIEAVTYLYADVTVSGSRASVTKERSMWTFCYEGRWYSFYIPRFGLFLIKNQG